MVTCKHKVISVLTMKACVGVELWLYTHRNLNTRRRWVLGFRLQPPFSGRKSSLVHWIADKVGHRTNGFLNYSISSWNKDFFVDLRLTSPNLTHVGLKVRLFLCRPGRWMRIGDIAPLIQNFESRRKWWAWLLYPWNERPVNIGERALWSL